MRKCGEKKLHTFWQSAVFFATYVFAFALVWIVAYAVVENEYVFPSLAQTFKATGLLLIDAFFYRSFLRTLLRVLVAFIVSFICAVGCAVLAKVFPFFGKVLAPIVAALRALPTLAVLLILLLWATPNSAPVIVAFLALFPLLYTGVAMAISTVDVGLEEMCAVYNVPIKRRILQMYLPIALPYVVKEAAGGASFALKLVVSAEVLAGTYISLGGMMQLSKIYLQTPQMFALAVLVIVFGVAFEGVGALLSRWLERGRV